MLGGWEGYPVPSRMLNNIPGLHPLDANGSFPLCQQTKMSPDLIKSHVPSLGQGRWKRLIPVKNLRCRVMMVEEEASANYIHAEPKFLSTLIANNYSSYTDIVRSILKQSNAEQMVLTLISRSLKIHVCCRWNDGIFESSFC